ncbi:MAG: hypothetical protein M1815_003925 [Lichina confinis]|nr:MAG: hypothetical protein M1815_003925 [Lichina confinis]
MGRHARRSPILPQATPNGVLDIDIDIDTDIDVRPLTLSILLRAMEIALRTSSVFSIAGTMFTLGTFLFCRGFNRPINRLVFFASWGNLITDIPALISQAGPRAGSDSALCQTQAFFVQSFCPADVYWTFAMALNVYLVMFRKYSAEQLKRLEWRYFVLCYGVPVALGLSYCFVRTDSRGRIYGNAVVWCWVTAKWPDLRFGTCYGLIWLSAAGTLAIYLAVGIKVYKAQRELRSLARSVSSVSKSGSQAVVAIKEIDIRVQHDDVLAMDLTDELEANIVHQEASPYRSKRSHSVVISGGKKSAESAQTDAAVAYAKIAFLFFLSLIITWGVPSINRIHQTAFPTRPNFALNFLACLVLPLQGLWNGIIYACASGSATKAAWRSLLESSEEFVDKLHSLVRPKPRRPEIPKPLQMEGGLPRR